jgi:hypothetical protein
MMGWILGFGVLLAPALIGLSFAVRTARRVGKAERAMRDLAARPGWQRVERDEDGSEWAGYAGHFPWLLRTTQQTTVTGPLGPLQVTVARRFEPLSSKDDLHWLIVCFEQPGGGPNLRLERHWSAAELNLSFARDVPYLPMSDDSAGTAERFYASDLPQRLMALAAPAVSYSENGTCFLFPLPEVLSMDRLLTGLATLLPDLATLAGHAPRDNG